jgi:type IV secretion system protein VirB8
MNEMTNDNLADYYRGAETWAADRERSHASSRRLAWIVAASAGTIAVLEAIALVVLLPLKTVVPYTLLVDRQTGYVQALKPLTRETVAPDTALVRSFLAQYVIAREGFEINSLRDSYRKVALWSQGEARSRYLSDMQASNPASPLAALPRQAVLEVQIRSVSSLNANTALVRFATTRTDPGGRAQPPQLWAAVLTYRFSGDAMAAEDRLINPLGFQVTRYRRDAEIVPVPPPAPTPAPTSGTPAAPTSVIRALPGARPPMSGATP